MTDTTPASATAATPATMPATTSKFVQWLEDPLGSVVAASAATIGSFGVVLSGIWAINLAVG